MKSGSEKTGTYRNEWDKLAQENVDGDSLDRYYERSGIYQYDAGLSPEKADEKAYKDVTQWRGGR